MKLQAVKLSVVIGVALALCGGGVPGAAWAQKTTDDGGLSKGTAQVKGGDGVFGVVYTMKSGYNLQLLSAKYTLEGQVDYDSTIPNAEQKVFVLTFAVKNPKKDSKVEFGALDLEVVDADGNNYGFRSGSTRLTKTGGKEMSVNMNPGQGYGQDPTTNALTMACVLPADAKIVKLLLKDGRANIASEQVMRFNIAGFPGGSPKNKIAPLPKYAADPTDPTGATMLKVSPAVLGKDYPTGYFAMHVNSVVSSDTELLKGEKPGDGKRWVIMSVTVRNTFYKKEVGPFYVGDDYSPVLVDADGEKYRPASDKRKATRDEEVNSETQMQPGESMTFRWFMEVPKDAKLKTLTFGGNGGHVYVLDVSDVK